MAILDLYMKIIDSIDNGEVALTIFLDFAKAFDTVNHNILFKKRYHYGVRDLPLKWFDPIFQTEYKEYLLMELHLILLKFTVECPKAVSWGHFCF